jgi:hypothetical protein
MEAPRSVKRRLAAILSADAKGYSRLMGRGRGSDDPHAAWPPRGDDWNNPKARPVEPVELLAVNERFLEPIQFRYPRIASKVFLNLTRIVSDRLQRMTEQYVAVQTVAS